MKKFLTISVLALLVIGLMCSCDPNANAKQGVGGSVKGVSFNISTAGNTRGADVVASNAFFENWNKEAFDWYFTATSDANNPVEKNVSINLTKMGEGYTFERNFYVGDKWTFTIYGVKKDTELSSTDDALFASTGVELTFEDVPSNTVNATISGTAKLKTGTGSIQLNLDYNPLVSNFAGKNATVKLVVGETALSDIEGVFNTDGKLTINNKVINNVACQSGTEVKVSIVINTDTPLNKVTVREKIYVYNGITTVLNVGLEGTNGSWAEGEITVKQVSSISFNFDFTELDPNKEYSITYKDAGGADFSGTHGENHPTKHTYGTETTLVEPTKTGYTFDGWYITSDCSGDAVTTLGAYEYTEVLTLYAKWTETSPASLLLLNGTFTVDSSSNKVQFTRGNLYWGGDTFEIEENQWDYQNYSANHVSHFYYSKDAAKAYAQSYNDDSKGTTDILFTNATETTANSSFTVAGETGKYRSLSKDEWTYLMNTRTASTVSETNNARYARVKINSDTSSVSGLLLFPDEFTWNETAMGTAPTNVNATNTTWGNVPTYTSEQFAAMEEAGCVFIPAAGYRSVSSLSGVGTSGGVWTASPYSGGSYSAYGMCFNSDNVDVYGGYAREAGRSVRLVADVE